MTTINRVKVLWGGSGVTGPGVSTFYNVGDALDLQVAVRTFFDAIKNTVPSSVSWTVETAGATIDDNTGEINGTWSGGTGGVINATNGGSFARGVGVRIVWQTAGVTNGRIVRGSTFIAPVTAGAYDTDGSIVTATLTTIGNAASALLTAVGPGELVILTRPTAEHSGTSHGVLSATVPDTVSWLTSRRT